MLVPTGLTIVERKDAKLIKQRNADNLPDVFMDADSMNVEQRYERHGINLGNYLNTKTPVPKTALLYKRIITKTMK